MMTPPCARASAIGLCAAMLWAAPGWGQPAADPPPAEPDEAAAGPEEAAEPEAPAEPGEAAAEPDEPPADPATLEAEGKQAMLARDCATAAARFDAFADAVKDDPEMSERRLYARLYAGVCYERLGELPEAAERLREVVYGGAPQDAMDKAEPLLQTVESQIPVPVTFVCEEVGITIALLDHPDEPKPCHEVWRLPEGVYRGAASAPDGREVPLTIQVRPGIPEEVVVLLPGAKRELVSSDPQPRPAGPVDRTLEWILTGGAVAALGTGVAFNFVARSAVDRGDEAYGRYERARAVGNAAGAAAARVEVEDAREDADTAAYTSYAFLGVGAALAGVAAWMWLDTPEAEAAALRVVPGPGGIGIVGQW